MQILHILSHHMTIPSNDSTPFSRSLCIPNKEQKNPCKKDVSATGESIRNSRKNQAMRNVSSPWSEVYK